MTKLTAENLRATLNAAQTKPTWEHIFAAIGASPSLAWVWQKASQRDADLKLGRQSKFFVEWDGIEDYWCPGHIRRAKLAFVSYMERKILDSAANDYTEIATCPQSGRPLQKILPQFAHYSRERAEREGIDFDVDIWEWVMDPLDPSQRLLDERGQPIPCYMEKVVRSAAMVKLRALASQINAWSDRSVQEVVHSGHVSVMHVAPPRFVPKEIRDQSADVVDADFTPIEDRPEPKSITDLRAFAMRHLDPNNSERVTRPDSPVLDATGRPINAKPDDLSKIIDAPDHEDGEGAENDPPMTVTKDRDQLKETRAYPQPSERPAYARKGPLNDPHHPNARAMKVTR